MKECMTKYAGKIKGAMPGLGRASRIVHLSTSRVSMEDTRAGWME